VAFTYRLMEAEMALAFGAGQRELLLHLWRRLCSISVWGALMMCLLLTVVGAQVLVFWTGGHTPMNWSLYALLLIAVVANSVWSAALALPFATNRYHNISIGYVLIYGGGAILGAYFAISMTGLAGAGMGVLLADIAMIAFVVPVAIRLGGGGWGAWITSVVRPPLFLLSRALLR
jgi:hypothetical protein